MYNDNHSINDTQFTMTYDKEQFLDIVNTMRI